MSEYICQYCKQPCRGSDNLCDSCWELIRRIEWDTPLAIKKLEEMGYTVSRADTYKAKLEAIEKEIQSKLEEVKKQNQDRKKYGDDDMQAQAYEEGQIDSLEFALSIIRKIKGGGGK